MAKIKQQKKRILTDRNKNLSNHAYKSQIRTAIKKFHIAITSKEEKVNLSLLVNKIVKLLDKSLTKKIHKKNFVNRHKSQILKKLHLFKQNQVLNKPKKVI